MSAIDRLLSDVRAGVSVQVHVLRDARDQRALEVKAMAEAKAENDRLRAALQRIADMGDSHEPAEGYYCAQEARAALR